MRFPPVRFTAVPAELHINPRERAIAKPLAGNLLFPPAQLECERESTSGRVARQGNVGGIDSLLEQRLHP
jgi:hypothetical protein